MGRALIGVMVGELYAATAGIGFMITVAGATFQTDKVFVGVLIFAISGMMIDRYEHRFDKWRPKVGRIQSDKIFAESMTLSHKE